MFTNYVVQGYSRNKRGGLIPDAPIQVQSARHAESRARRLAEIKAGVIALAQSGDHDTGDFHMPTVIFTAGETPDILD